MASGNPVNSGGAALAVPGLRFSVQFLLAATVSAGLLARWPETVADWARDLTCANVRALGALLGPAIAKAASEQLVQPDVFRGVAEYYGYDRSQPLPNRVAIAGSLKALEDGRVCATRDKDGPCLLVFTEEEGVWRLTGFEGDVGMLRR